MAKQITGLTEETTTANGDFAVIRDTSAAADRKVQLSNLAPVGSITPEKLVSGTGTDWDLDSWTPTFTNLSGGTLNYAKTKQVGKFVFCEFKYTLTGANISGAVSFTLPVSEHADYTSTFDMFNSSVSLLDSGSAVRPGGIFWNASGSARILYLSSSPAYSALSSSAPHTWASGDVIMVAFYYVRA